MKKSFIIICFLVSAIAVRAQDTIFPFAPDYPFYRESITQVQGDAQWRLSPVAYWDLRVLKHTIPQSFVSGLAIPYVFGTRILDRFGEPYPGSPDSILIYGVLMQIDSNDYEHPTIHYTRPVVWIDGETPKVRPYDCYLAFKSDTECGPMDTVVEAYSLYFDSALSLSGDVYLGIRRKAYPENNGNIYGHYNNGEGVWDPPYIPDSNKCVPFANHAVELVYNLFNTDASDSLSNYFSQDGVPTFQRVLEDSINVVFADKTICPILAVPDTDSFSCPVVEGFAFAGIYAGYPTFVWDTAVEHGLYQFAYGAYDTPLDSLTVVETNNWYHELITTLSPDVYYQARLRAKCHHSCPVHDTVMWTAWTDPVYFYTGDHMPDTTHHEEPEGIAGAEGQANFTLAPNPARGNVTLTLTGVPAQGTTLTLHDAAGREVLRRTLSEQHTTIPTAELPAGVYTVTVSGPQGSSVRRLVIE